ncbi:hypothetical protein I4U23_015519 [Adineta vaga]|nr:hypothetical protein I4U23_015519 [Adineta vaga]
MLTISHIEFKHDPYNHAVNCALLLHEMQGVCAVIKVPHARIINFIQVFYATIDCQNYIRENMNKQTALFAYDRNMRPWLAVTRDIPNNLKEIKIFCHCEDYSYVRDWTNLYRERFQNTTFDICTFDDLNTELLTYGLKYIRKLRRQFKNDINIINQLDQDFNDIRNALEDQAIRRATVDEM